VLCMGRPHPQRQGRLFQDSGTDGLHRVRTARLGRHECRSHSHDIPRPHERLRGQSSASMTKLYITAVVFVLAMPAQIAAHRLDEYLQAARVSLTRQQIALEIDMTPGVNVAQVIVVLLDRNGDGTISESEAGAYGNAVLKEVVLELDGQAVPLTLARVEIPSPEERWYI